MGPIEAACTRERGLERVFSAPQGEIAFFCGTISPQLLVTVTLSQGSGFRAGSRVWRLWFRVQGLVISCFLVTCEPDPVGAKDSWDSVPDLQEHRASSMTCCWPSMFCSYLRCDTTIKR